MYKIAVLGDRDSIYGYASIGLSTFPVENAIEASKTLKSLVESKYAVIYITESYQNILSSEIEKYSTNILPAIIPIPGIAGNNGIGIANVKKSVEKAVGSDILFNGN